MLCRLIFLTAFMMAAVFADAQVADPDRPGSERMTVDNYMINTPSWSHMAEALRAYRIGQFRRAFGRFRLAANWANKHAQAWIGWLYTTGQGVEQDVPRAYAWLKLAAERGYPTFVEDVEALRGTMSPEELAHGELILSQELLPQLGDEVAVRRTSREMWSERMKVSGSRVGYTGNLQVVDHADLGTFYGGAFYAADRWNLKRVIQFETRLHFAMANTSIKLHDLHLPGKIEPADKETDEPDSSRESEND